MCIRDSINRGILVTGPVTTSHNTGPYYKILKYITLLFNFLYTSLRFRLISTFFTFPYWVKIQFWILEILELLHLKTNLPYTSHIVYYAFVLTENKITFIVSCPVPSFVIRQLFARWEMASTVKPPLTEIFLTKTPFNRNDRPNKKITYSRFLQWKFVFSIKHEN